MDQSSEQPTPSTQAPPPASPSAQPGQAALPKPQVEKRSIIAAMSYIGPLVFVSYILAENDPFIKFHVKQGAVLLIMEVLLWILTAFFFFYPLWMLWQIMNFAIIILAIIGIVFTLQGKQKELPLVGQFAVHIPL